MTRPLTVLVVDDDTAVCDVIRHILEAEGCAVLQATGPAAVRLAQAKRPDLILLDVLMPRMNGVEVSRLLQATRATAHIPIISMSAHMQEQTPFAMEANGHLAKPFDLDSLLAAVQHWRA